MPISIEAFDAAPDPDLRPAAAGAENERCVSEFLAENAEQAFTPAEVREATGVPRGSVCVVLSRLEDEGRVRHRGQYWAAPADATD